MAAEIYPVDLSDASSLAYEQRLTANARQGPANRSSPRVYLDYGVYDDQSSRRTCAMADRHQKKGVFS
jgi:hypothetical protein